MEFAYFSPPQTQGFPYMNGVPFPQGLEDHKLAGTEPLEQSFLPPNYDTFSYAHFSDAGQTSPTHPTSQNHIRSVSSIDSGIDLLGDGRRASLTRASSEEKENSLTPAQSRRKAQNRAAQRAFRERKERHVRDLEAKLSALETSQHSLQTDNERLKLALQRMTTENEMLRGVSSTSRPSSLHLSSSNSVADDSAYSASPSVSGASSRGQLLTASAAWDLVQRHPLVKQGLVDIADVCERLKGVARCDGQGPVYEEGMVWRAVEESNRGGGDELI